MPVSKYYNFNKLLSYNATYNFCVGGRGLGKTYGSKKKGIKDAISTAIKKGPENCDQFIYLRRYKEELQVSKITFFADIVEEFPDWDFRDAGYEAQMSPVSERENKKRPWHTIGYFIALSVAQKYKSVAFPRVKVIIYDEFIVEKGVVRYLPNEVNAFNNFFSTVDRWKDKTRVLFIANAVQIENPYFIEYQIDPAKADKDGLIKLNRGFIVAHFPESSDFQNEVFQTAFGKFIEGTDYADFAVANQFSDAHEGLIGSKTPKSKYMFTLEAKSGVMFAIWYDLVSGQYFCQAKRPKVENVFTLAEGRMSEGKTLMTFADRPLAMLRTAFRHARVAFDKPQTRNAFLEIFKR